MGKTSGKGSVLSINNQAVAGLNKFGGIDLSVEAVDATDMNSVSDEVIAGEMKSGEISMDGLFDSADAGQQAVETAFLNKEMVQFQQTTPNAFAISGTGLITKYRVGDIDKSGNVPFSASIKPSGAVQLNRTKSAGLSNLAVSGAGTAIVPAFSNGQYEYTVNIATGVSSVTITPTGANQVITVTVDGLSQAVTSGSPSSAITLGAAGTRKTALITAQESGKIPIVYVVDLVRAAS